MHFITFPLTCLINSITNEHLCKILLSTYVWSSILPGYQLDSIHEKPSAVEAVRTADALFIGKILSVFSWLQIKKDLDRECWGLNIFVLLSAISSHFKKKSTKIEISAIINKF